MLSKTVENAQKKVEENHFGTRKRLLEYDDVMNAQREVVYTKRRNALSGERVEIDVMNMMQDIAQIIVEKSEGMPYDEFAETVMMSLSIEPGFDEEFYNSANAKALAEALRENMIKTYQRRMDTMAQRALPFIRDMYKKYEETAKGTNIYIPISDGRKGLHLPIDLQKAYESDGKEIARSLSKTITLFEIDDKWKEHLRDMDDLKQSVQNATYEQKDPLLIYKFESFNLFSQMLEDLNKNVLSFLLRAQIPLAEAAAPRQAPQPQRRQTPDVSQLQTSRTDLVTNGGQAKSNAPVHVEKQVGRNDPCPCGSGKKFKNCHGKDL
jgi:preprotein translocase subunit SecA